MTNGVSTLKSCGSKKRSSVSPDFWVRKSSSSTSQKNAGRLSLEALAEFYRDYPQVSLRAFARAAGISYCRLRDFIQTEQLRQRREKRHCELRQAVKRLALAFPSYGYRPLHRELLAGCQGRQRESPASPRRTRFVASPMKKPRYPAPDITPTIDYPPGRRTQIDATQVRLEAGKAWVYLVEDVLSRALLAIRAVRSLSQEAARETLAEAVGGTAWSWHSRAAWRPERRRKRLYPGAVPGLLFDRRSMDPLSRQPKRRDGHLRKAQPHL